MCFSAITAEDRRASPALNPHRSRDDYRMPHPGGAQLTDPKRSRPQQQAPATPPRSSLKALYEEILKLRLEVQKAPCGHIAEPTRQ